MIDISVLKNEEKAVFALRSLYQQYGYLPFKMSKFEEYDLYVRNKDFLVSDSVITFNDTDGRLLALKPDVTLSIIKNTVDGDGVKQKVYYNENVYRVSGKTHRFKEIMQTGLECIGDTDIYDVLEVIYLAAKSLDGVSSDFVLDISHMGILSAVLSSVTNEALFKKEITKLISEKNRHEAEALCASYSIGEEDKEAIMSFFELYGDVDEVLERLSPICEHRGAEEALTELKTLWSFLSKTEFSGKIRFDFSVINDMNYYNGIVFRGFLSGVSEGVLSGGEYGMLMRRMGRRSKAIGFALYLDLLEELGGQRRDVDVDVIILYSENTPAELIISKKTDLIKGGKSVLLSKSVPEKIRYREIIDLDRK